MCSPVLSCAHRDLACPAAYAERLVDAKVSKRRVLRSGAAGFISHGPQLHFWSLILDRYVVFGSGAWALRGAVLAKIALDQTFFALYINAAYCMTLELLKRSPLSLALTRIRRAAWPSLKRSWQFWPMVHLVTFGLVPQHLRVLWVDCVEVVWVAVLASCVSSAVDATPHESTAAPDADVEQTETRAKATSSMT